VTRQTDIDRQKNASELIAMLLTMRQTKISFHSKKGTGECRLMLSVRRSKGLPPLEIRLVLELI